MREVTPMSDDIKKPAAPNSKRVEEWDVAIAKAILLAGDYEETEKLRAPEPPHRKET
jgi:hypothetical protein